MITDDQVVTLLRDAGNAGPMPAPVDARDVVGIARRERTRSRAAVGLVVALCLIAAATIGAPHALLATPEAGAPTTASWWPWPVVIPAVLLVALAAVSLAVRRAPAGSTRRTVPAALWGVAAFTLLLLSWPVLYSLLMYLSPPLPKSIQIKWAGVAAYLGVAALAWLSLIVRQRLLARPRGSMLISSCLTASTISALVLSWLLLAQVLAPARKGTGTLVAAVVGLAVVAVLLGWVASRRVGSDRPGRTAVGGYLLMVGAAATVVWFGQVVLLRTDAPVRWGMLGGFVAIGLVAAALAAVGAWWVERPGPRRAARTLSTWAAAVITVAAGHELSTTIWSGLQSVAREPHEGFLGYLLWGAGMTLAATWLLVQRDRRVAPWPDLSAAAPGTTAD